MKIELIIAKDSEELNRGNPIIQIKITRISLSKINTTIFSVVEP
jgi:hypothetical protein